MTIHRSLLSIDSDEKIKTTIHRHRFGLFVIYFLTILIGFGIIALIAASLNDRSLFADLIPNSITLPVLIVFLVLDLGIGFISGVIYQHNILVITNENLVQILQNSLFSRKVSQLSLSKIQDITVNQNGVFAHMFNYGTIEIETAGEIANFSFPFAVDPYVNSNHIMEAHEDFVQRHGQQNDF